jgi:hypothetical protein
MNLLKSIFISSFMMLNMFLGITALWMILMRGESFLGWSGVIFASVPVMGVLSWLMVTKSVARTSSNFPVLQILGAVGIALSGLSWLRNETGILPLFLSAAGFTALLLYVYWYWGSDSNGTESYYLRLKVLKPNFNKGFVIV